MKLSRKNKVALDEMINLDRRSKIAHKAAMDAFPIMLNGLLKLQQDKRLAVTDEEVIHSALTQAKNYGILAGKFYGRCRNTTRRKNGSKA